MGLATRLLGKGIHHYSVQLILRDLHDKTQSFIQFGPPKQVTENPPQKSFRTRHLHMPQSMFLDDSPLEQGMYVKVAS